MNATPRLARIAALMLVALIASASMGGADELPPLKTGDIVFQESGNPQSAAIALASSSPYTHTGLVEIDSQGRANVVEAAGPVQTVPLEAWIKKGVGQRVTIMRVTDLSADEASKVLKAAHVYDGRPYDIYFHEGRDAIYCSELVALAFSEGIGRTVGHVQRIGELDLAHDAVQALIGERWQRHPACVAAHAQSREACEPILMQQILITPGSIAADKSLTAIYSTFDPGPSVR